MEKALKKAIGAPPPHVSGVSTKHLTAFWIGPDQWMVEAPFESHEDLASHLAPMIKGCGYVAEQTDAWARFDLKGAPVLSVLELLCNLNTRSMEIDTVSRTSIHHLGCFVRSIATDHFAIYGPRASAQSLHHAITTAMHSVQ
jgi:sarcosine oxidase subunit gamma